MGLFDALAGMLKIRKEQVNILVVGLNNSGKSTIVNHFKHPDEKASFTVPTVGFTVERFQSELIIIILLASLIVLVLTDQGVCFTAFDMSGAGRYRNLWEHHFRSCQGIVFVIDSSDKMRLGMCDDLLQSFG